MKRAVKQKPITARHAAKLVGRAVVIRWKNMDHDWQHFRVERVEGERIALTGMTDDSGNQHDGGFFWCHISDLTYLELRY